MTDRNYILAPETISVKFQLAPARACLESLELIADADDFDGLDEWIYTTREAMSPEQRYNNDLVMHGMFHCIQKLHIEHQAMAEFLDHLETLNAVELRDNCLETLLGYHDHKITKMDREPFPAPTAEHLLEDVEHYVDYLTKLYGDHVNEPLLRDVHALYTKPTSMKALLVHHLHDMWNKYLADEWQRVEPRLRASVDAYSKMSFSGMSIVDIASTVTGRDFRGNVFLNEEIQGGTEIVFYPAPHIGPYVTVSNEDGRIDIVFRARMPDVVPSPSPQIDRSDLLVRLGALADDTRMQILNLLLDGEELCAPQIMKVLGLSQSAASRHLRQLSATGFLTERRHEGAKCYSLNQRRVEEVIQALQDHLLS
jgi:DNA-binding transcriptional ArsR family regulator